MSFTKCCNLRYIGENHNPIGKDGMCRNCGYPRFKEGDKKTRCNFCDEDTFTINGDCFRCGFRKTSENID